MKGSPVLLCCKNAISILRNKEVKFCQVARVNNQHEGRSFVISVTFVSFCFAWMNRHSTGLNVSSYWDGQIYFLIYCEKKIDFYCAMSGKRDNKKNVKNNDQLQVYFQFLNASMFLKYDTYTYLFYIFWLNLICCSKGLHQLFDLILTDLNIIINKIYVNNSFFGVNVFCQEFLIPQKLPNYSRCTH